MFHETLYQKTKDGVPFVKCLNERGIIPGIKVDKGIVTLMGTEEESTTQGKGFLYPLPKRGMGIVWSLSMYFSTRRPDDAVKLLEPIWLVESKSTHLT